MLDLSPKTPDPLELDLDVLRERHLFPEDGPQLFVERGGVERGSYFNVPKMQRAIVATSASRGQRAMAKVSGTSTR